MGNRTILYVWIVMAVIASTGCDRLSGPTLEEQERFEELKRKSEKELIAVRPFLEEEVLPGLDTSGKMPSDARIKELEEAMKERLGPAVSAGAKVWKFAKETGQVESNKWVLEEYHSIGSDLWVSAGVLSAYDIMKKENQKSDVLVAVRPDVEDAVEAIRELEEARQ